MVDLDNSFEYSPYRSINIRCGTKRFSLRSNPLVGERLLILTFSAPKANEHIQIIDIHGGVLKSIVLDSNNGEEIKIDLSDFVLGTYLVKISSGSSQKIIIAE